LPPVSLNRRLRDARRLSIAGQVPRSSWPAEMLRSSCGSPAFLRSGSVFKKNEHRMGWQGASRGKGSPQLFDSG